jgi:hypothetical protein
MVMDSAESLRGPSDEHIAAVVKAAQAVEPIIMSLEFVISRGGTGSGGCLSGGEAWRYITKRIMQAAEMTHD